MTAALTGHQHAPVMHVLGFSIVTEYLSAASFFSNGQIQTLRSIALEICDRTAIAPVTAASSMHQGPPPCMC